MTSTIAYTTQSDGLVLDYRAPEFNEPPVVIWEHEPHCFVCMRHTDHFAEHDSLVAIGLASYSEDGDVYVTDFARTAEGAEVRIAYDRAIWQAINTRGVVLIKPEGAARTFAMLAGITIPAS